MEGSGWWYKVVTIATSTVAKGPSRAGIMIIFKCQRVRERERETSTNQIAQNRKEDKEGKKMIRAESAGGRQAGGPARIVITASTPLRMQR